MYFIFFFFCRDHLGEHGGGASLSSSTSAAPLSVCIALDSLFTNIAAENLNAKLSSPLNYDSESSQCSDSLAAVSPAAGSNGFSSDAAERTRRASRDDRILASLGIPFNAVTIINCSMEEFNSILVNSGLREDQVNTCRDMRRRGKNKIAAQNCRKRKVDQISSLAEEVEVVRERKVRLLGERARLSREHEAWLERLRRLEGHILGALARRGQGGGEDGRLVSGQFVELTQGRQLVS